jgi:ABC-type polar amino acid transport system ATPase subunit
MREKALVLLDYMNLSDKVSRKPTELSGGERQRVVIPDPWPITPP